MSLIFLLSIIGLCVSVYIRNQKKKGQPLICLPDHDCGKVINSPYSSFLGFHNEDLGIAYYLFWAVLSLVIFPRPGIMQIAAVVIIMKAIAGIAVVYSLYLTNIQIFKLKDFCVLCSIANFINLLIFIILVI